MYEIELIDSTSGKNLCVTSDGVYEASDTENSPIRMTLDASGSPSLLTVETIEPFPVSSSAVSVLWYGSGVAQSFPVAVGTYFSCSLVRVRASDGYLLPMYLNSFQSGKYYWLSAGAFSLSGVGNWTLMDGVFSMSALSGLNIAGYYYFASFSSFNYV